MALREELEKSAQGSKMQAHRRTGHAALAALEKIPPKMVCGEIRPGRQIRRLAKLNESVPVIRQRARRGIALNFEEAEKVISEAIAIRAFQNAAMLTGAALRRKVVSGRRT
jgi:hypothetical protein